MCGIALACVSGNYDKASTRDENENGLLQEAASVRLLAALDARGPDFIGEQSVVVPGGAWRLHFVASLLQLRGLQPGSSPAVSSQGHILCFNGEVFGGLEVAAGENDGARLLEALVAAAECEEAVADPSAVPRVLSGLRGPWALLFWDQGQQRLWFGRDVLGRRSLLVHFPDALDPRLLLSSVSELPGGEAPAAAAGQPPPLPPSGDAPAALAAAASTARSTPATAAAAAAPEPRDGGDTCGGAGGGDDARPDAEDAEPSGSDGYWTELPPGVYSISFVAAASEPSLPPPATAVAVTRGLPHASVREESQPTAEPAVSADADAGGCGDSGGEQRDQMGSLGMFRRLAVGGGGHIELELCLERHAWRDPLPLQLESYCREESEPAGLQQRRQQQQQQQPGASDDVQTAAADSAAAAAADESAPPPRPASTAEAAQKGDAPAESEGTEGTEGPACAGSGSGGAFGAGADPGTAAVGAGADGTPVAGGLLPSWLAAAAPETGTGARPASRPPPLPPPPPPASSALLGRPGRCPAPDPGEELAQALLGALTAAMRVRCACIEMRSPHPAASYAAALNAAAATARTAAAAATMPSFTPTAFPAPALAQPSWRRDDPLSFCLASDSGSPCGGAAAAARGGSRDSVPRPTFAASSACAGASASCDTVAAAAAGPCVAMERPVGQCDGARPLDAPVMILFSGGVDSVLLAALAHRVLPPGVPIDLSNVCFAGGGAPSPDREAARDALEELAAACPGRQWRLVEVDATLEDVDRHRSRLLALLRPAHTVMDLNIGAALWLATSGQGTLRLPAASTAPADSASDPVPKLETRDAASEAPGPNCAAPSSQPSAPTCPSPSATAAAAGAAAALSSESVSGPAAGAFYGSAARVVLLGHGADEQCGGYGRHRTRFRSGGWEGLAAELEVDVRRLWLRNLGRDDRLVADWGREGRHPFLDEEVMRLLLTSRLDSILDPRLPPGQGDKRVLRLALALLGLHRSAARVKRAIQFGSRIGKVSNRRDFGSNRAANKKNAGGVALQDVKAAAASVAGAAWVKPAKGK